MPGRAQRTLRNDPASGITVPASGLMLIESMNASLSDSFQTLAAACWKNGVSFTVSIVYVYTQINDPRCYDSHSQTMETRQTRIRSMREHHRQTHRQVAAEIEAMEREVVKTRRSNLTRR